MGAIIGRAAFEHLMQFCDSHHRTFGDSLSGLGDFGGRETVFKKTVLFWAISIVMGLYTTFALTLLWNWFVVPVFHVAVASFWLVYGLVLIVGLLRFSDNDDEMRESERRLVIVITAIEFCIPEEKREAAKESVQHLMDQQLKGLWFEVGLPIVGQAFATTATLAAGFVVHILASS